MILESFVKLRTLQTPIYPVQYAKQQWCLKEPIQTTPPPTTTTTTTTTPASTTMLPECLPVENATRSWVNIESKQNGGVLDLAVVGAQNQLVVANRSAGDTLAWIRPSVMGFCFNVSTIFGTIEAAKKKKCKSMSHFFLRLRLLSMTVNGKTVKTILFHFFFLHPQLYQKLRKH